MCGIAGIVALPGGAPPRTSAIQAMCDVLTHRGPDAEGIDIDGAVGIGMRRLSIIDVEGGRQPFFNEDRTVRAVFNGEIYNYRRLRRELEGRRHCFASASDGEVLVHLWEEFGDDFVTRLNGMFAIALHDSRRGRLVLARDRLGVKPLFYGITPHYLVFASEIKALLATGLFEPALDMDALGQFLSWEYVPAPGTLFRGIRKLEPGSMLALDLANSVTRVSMWWDLPHSAAVSGCRVARTAGEWEEAIDAKLGEAVNRQMVSDVPLGGFLSGGVDSSLVAAQMGQARVFSIGFDDPSYNEVAWASAVATHLGLDHTVEVIEQNVVDLFPRLMDFMDDPIGDFSIFPTYLVSRLARRDVTVVLTGDGGDELFGGYDTYVAEALARTWNCFPPAFWRRVVEPALRRVRPSDAKKGLVNKAKRFAEGLGHAAALGHARWRLFADEGLRRRLLTPDAQRQLDSPVEDHILRLFDRAGDRSPVDRALYVDMKSYLPDNCLVKVDRMSMACSLEARVPFLDHELVELAFAMPGELKLAGRRSKVLLKKVATRHVPPSCVYREKQGFSIPIKTWLKTDFRPVMEDLLDHRRLAADGIFEADTVASLKREHLSDRANHSHLLWPMLVFQDWRRRWSV